MSKSRSRIEETISREDLRRAKSFRKWKVNWPQASFVLIVLGLIAAAAVWQKSLEPARKEGWDYLSAGKKSVAEIESLTELESLAEEAEQRLADESVTYAGKVAILDQLAVACARLQALTKEPAEITKFKSKELLARYFKLMTCAEQGLEDQAGRDQVLKLVEELSAADDPDARYHVNLARLVLVGSSLVLRPDSNQDFRQCLEVVREVVRGNVDDTRLAALNRHLIDEFKQQKRFPSANYAELARELVAAYSTTGNLAIQTWIRELDDELLFEEHRYRDLLIKCELNTPGAYEEYLTALPLILAGRPTPLGYGRLLSAGNSFERVNRVAEAEEVYRQIAASLPQPAADELAEVVRACESGRQRLARLGRPFEFSGVDVLGRELVPADFLGKPTVIVYCTLRDEGFKAQLDKLQIDTRVFVRRGVSLLLVCLDGTVDQVTRELSESDLKLFRVIADPDRSTSLWRQSAAEVLPLIVLVNTVGEVQRYANLDVHLMTTIDGELSKGPR